MTATARLQTLDPANQIVVDRREERGLAALGLMSSQSWNDDPKRTVFMLARYKFVAKMLAGRQRVLEVGCGDAFGSRIVIQAVGALTAVDREPLFVEDARSRMDTKWPLTIELHDILERPVAGEFDAAYCLDVMEHIQPAREDRFIGNILASLTAHGALIVGMPSLESQCYASPQSRMGHVNCKRGEDLRAVMERHFHNVFLFSMNDEVVHTGFSGMAHYLLALCCTPRR
jgi:SAM-dependent methyltransferase